VLIPAAYFSSREGGLKCTTQTEGRGAPKLFTRRAAERELVKSLRHYGVGACLDLPDYSDTTDSDGEEASSGPVHSPSSPLKVPAKQKEPPSSVEPEISAKKAKRWLESL
jgi:hypothetical protein